MQVRGRKIWKRTITYKVASSSKRDKVLEKVSLKLFRVVDTRNFETCSRMSFKAFKRKLEEKVKHNGENVPALAPTSSTGIADMPMGFQE
jgi:hypothetical protein